MWDSLPDGIWKLKLLCMRDTHVWCWELSGSLIFNQASRREEQAFKHHSVAQKLTPLFHLLKSRFVSSINPKKSRIVFQGHFLIKFMRPSGTLSRIFKVFFYVNFIFYEIKASCLFQYWKKWGEESRKFLCPYFVFLILKIFK